MLATIYYIITPDALSQSIGMETDNILVVQADVSDDSGLLNCYHRLNTFDPACRFCLSITTSNKIEDETANDLIAFFFYPNYYKEKGVPVMIVQGEDAESFTDSISHWTKLQGYEQITMIAAKTGIITYDSSNRKLIKQAYKEVVSRIPSDKNLLFIKVSQMADIAEVNEIIKEEEQQFKHEHPKLFFLQEQNKELTNRLQQLEVNLKAAEQEISNQHSHIRVFRSGAQAVHLQNYYNNEYEMLPLWYKRLGHVLKVIMGKRTFKSLFNKNEKKYR